MERFRRCELANTFSNIGTTPKTELTGVNVDNVKVELSGMVALLNGQVNLLDSVERLANNFIEGSVVDENLQSIIEAVHEVSKSLARSPLPIVNVSTPQPSIVVSPASPMVNVQINIPWMLYAILGMNLAGLCLIYLK